jgi:hypothetical protein
MKRTLRFTLYAVGTLTVCYMLAVIGFRAEPSGYVEGYSIIRHETNDALEFAGGKVTAKTCCGDFPMGTYERMADGRWIWHSQLTPKAKTGDVLVESHLFWLTFSGCTTLPHWNRSVRRRLLTPFYL